MDSIKVLERELISDWQHLQRIESQVAKDIALKAYYIKLELYRKALKWQLVLQDSLSRV